MQFISWYFCISRTFTGQSALRTKVFAQRTIIFKLLSKFEVASIRVYACELTYKAGVKGAKLCFFN